MDFRAAYKRSDYINFFRNNLLPEDFVDHSEDVALGFKPQSINNAVKIGDVPSLELNIYEVRHPSENDPRVSLSRDAFRLLAQYGIKHALIIFASENSANFRLSLVTIDLKWEEGKRVQKEYSNPRRYSFFLGPETKTHTPEEYLIKQGRVKNFDDLKSRFSIEVVNKDFYTQIAVLFTQLAGGKRTIGRKSIDAGRGLLNLPSTVDDTLDKEFTVRLIGRLVFCWFLKKKRSDKNISLLPDELLSAKAVSENKGYYHGVLEPLFFEVLNTPVDNRDKKYQGSPWFQIPFLNGGLFTPHRHDFYEPGPLGISKHINTLKVPDRWIKVLFEVFETYNFTIDENTSIDVELSIEPEMLGRIFENLLAEINPETGETARKATGSYYTPRPIVEYMVDESLKQYLLTKTNLDEIKIKSLLTYEDLAVKLNESEKESVLTALDAVKVIDPACGSGAFPMGILQKMLLILQKVDPESEWWLERKLSQIESKLLKKELGKKLKSENVNYVHKLGIIQSSIYGVDIQPIAVEISKLRFFLSLIVDEKVDDAKENRGIEPLPNLEFKFVCTNSLIGLPKNEKSPDQLFETEDTQSINELKDLRDEYLRSYGIEKEKIQIKFLKTQRKMAEFYWKQVLRPQADLYGSEKKMKKQDGPEFTRMLSNWDPFSDESAGWFDPEWMFGIKDGFDIVIANPPYVRANNMDKELREYWQKSGEFETISGKFDIYILFIEKAIKLLKNNGILSYIVPYPVLSQNYAQLVRKYILQKCCIESVYDISEMKVFDAVVSTCVLILRCEVNNNIRSGNIIRVRKSTIEFTQIKDWKIPQIFFENTFQNMYRLNAVLGADKVSERMWKVSKPFSDYCYIGIGIDVHDSKTGLDKSARIHTNSKGAHYKPYVEGKEIKRYCAPEWSRYLEYLPEKMHRPKYPEMFETEKILVQVVVGREGIIATFDKDNLYAEQTLSVCVPKYVLAPTGKKDTEATEEQIRLSKDHKVPYLLGLLCSKLINWYFKTWLSDELHIVPENLRQLPMCAINFKNIDEKAVYDEMVKHVNQIINAKRANPQADIVKIENRIDQIVYKLYGLTKNEIETVESLVKDK